MNALLRHESEYLGGFGGCPPGFWLSLMHSRYRPGALAHLALLRYLLCTIHLRQFPVGLLQPAPNLLNVWRNRQTLRWGATGFDDRGADAAAYLFRNIL